MKIGFISQWYDPEEGSAAVPGSMVRALESRGHEVTVLTGFPNYPHGRLYDGYHLRPVMKDDVRGTSVRRVALYPAHGSSPAKRVANYTSFAASASTLGLGSLRDVDVCLVYSTPATVAAPALVARRLLGKPFLLYIQDLWPDTVTATGLLPAGHRASLAVSALHRFCNHVYQRAAHVGVIAPTMRDLLAERGVPPEKIDVIFNWVDEDLFKVVDRAPAASRDIFSVMYAGNIGNVQGLDVAVRALALLNDLPDVELHLVGSGVAVDSIRELASTCGVQERVRFLGSRPVTEMAETMAQADVQLVCLRDIPLFRATMPSKMQAILASGQPVISSAPGDVGELVNRAQAGISCPPEDPHALAQAVRAMHDMEPSQRKSMGRRGRSFYETELAATVGAQRLERALVKSLRNRNGPTG